MRTILSKMWIILLGIITMLLVCNYFGIYINLNNNLSSAYDEGFFYTILKSYSCQLTVFTQPLSLGIDMLVSLFPSLKDMSVLELRQCAFFMKLCGICILLPSLIVYEISNTNLTKYQRLERILILFLSVLLMGKYVLPSEVININDILLFLQCLIVSLCIVYISVNNFVCKLILTSLVGFFGLLAILCNAPAGGGVVLISCLFLLLYDGFDWRKSASIIFYICVGFVVGFFFVHYLIISITDIITFVQKAIVQTTAGGIASHHSLDKIFIVAFLGIRDLIITTIILCGITYFYEVLSKYQFKQWILWIVIGLLFFIVVKWTTKPAIQLPSIIAWFVILFYKNIKEEKINVSPNEMLIVLFLFLLPLGASFGTNSSLLNKSLQNIISWGVLLFVLYVKSINTYNNVVRATLVGFVLYVLLSTQTLNIFINKGVGNNRFTQEYPITEMNLNSHQYDFYHEVYDILISNGYIGGRDTLLGFCFNEMTVVAMNAIPYTNDQLPEEFLRHDLTHCPPPKYIILSEWDSVVLYDKFSTLDWDFPKGYNYYKCINNPDPDSGYTMTQSMIFIKKI